MRNKKLTNEEIVMDGYKALYAAATPSADFEELINNCLKYVDKDGMVHYTETPLSKEETIERGWMKDIDYMNYHLDEETYKKIVEEKIKEHKLTGYRKEGFKTQMYLGCGPSINEEKINN